MAPEHRYIVAFVAASLKDGKTHTHVYDHDAGREIAIGGMVRPARVQLIEGFGGARIEGEPSNLFHFGSSAYIQLAMDDEGFGGYDCASKAHFRGAFQDKGVVQLFDHETGRYHAFHVT